jgi:hypothetical protein
MYSGTALISAPSTVMAWPKPLSDARTQVGRGPKLKKLRCKGEIIALAAYSRQKTT